jgi:histidyl-tRNA synthetase
MSEKKLQTVRGMNDLLPADSKQYNFIKNTITDVLISFGYENIRTPIVENTAVFHRAIGGDTDVVSKEMYSWQDGKENISLRPEGTAGVVRAMIESNLPREGVQKLFYHGAMFRHERPQKGRYRQFFQFGAEVFGLEKSKIDAELIMITAQIWQKLGIKATLEINSLGSNEARENYRTQLVEYFEKNIEALDEDSLKRLKTNPLRILDSKNPDLKAVITNAPKLLECLDDESKNDFDELLEYLKDLEIDYKINQTLVRGLDYYNKTVFEWVSYELGAQGTICAGGRYDTLVEKMGGKPTPAIGFAMGMERLSLLVKKEIPQKTSIYICVFGENTQSKSLQISQILSKNKNLILYNDCSFASFKSQLKKADKKNCDYAFIIGENEAQNDEVLFKYLKTKEEQKIIKNNELESFIQQIIQ